MGNKILFFLSFILLFAYSSAAQNQPAVPAYINYVNDFANVLSDQEEQMLNAKIKEIKDSTVTEIAIVIEGGLNGQDEFDRSLDFARAYKVGGEGVNSGVLIYVAIQEHKIFIQTADKTQGALTDYITKIIIDKSITPEFKAGNYYQGLDNGVESIYQTLKGEFNPDKLVKKKKKGSVFFYFVPGHFSDYCLIHIWKRRGQWRLYQRWRIFSTRHVIRWRWIWWRRFGRRWRRLWWIWRRRRF